MSKTADQIIETLGIQRHPEGGGYVETFRDVNGPDGRARSTAIYYLLEAGEHSHWHRVDALEVWHWHAGSPLQLSISADGKTSHTIELGPDIVSGQRPQGTVPTHAWQAAQSLGAWSLGGCTVAPGFEFAGFEMAPADWTPADHKT